MCFDVEKYLFELKIWLDNVVASKWAYNWKFGNGFAHTKCNWGILSIFRKRNGHPKWINFWKLRLWILNAGPVYGHQMLWCRTVKNKKCWIFKYWRIKGSWFFSNKIDWEIATTSTNRLILKITCWFQIINGKLIFGSWRSWLYRRCKINRYIDF